MKKLFLLIIAVFLIWGMQITSAQGLSSSGKSQLGEEANQQIVQFSDVLTHWAKEAIERAVESGIVKGYPDGTFRPDATISRAEFLALVTRSSTLSDRGGKEPFTDVSDDHWAVDAINKAIGMEFINSEEIGSEFRANEALTRAEMVKWLVNGLAGADSNYAQALEDTKNTILPFTEFYHGDFEKEDIPYIAVARGTGLVGGFPDGSFGPDRTTTRAEVVVLLERYLNVEGTNAEKYKALNELREVGTTGTNVVTIGEAYWMTDPHGVKRPFYDVFGKELVLKKEVGTVVLEKLLLIDDELSSVYTDMFVDVDEQKRMKNNSRHTVVSLVTLTTSRDLKFYDFADSVPGVTGTTFQHRFGLPEKYGYRALLNNGVHPELKKNNTSTFWSPNPLNPKGHILINAKEDNAYYGLALNT